MAKYSATIEATLKRRAKCYYCGATYTYEMDTAYVTTSDKSKTEAEDAMRQDCESGRAESVFSATKGCNPCPRCGRWTPGKESGDLALACILNLFSVPALMILASAIVAFSGEDEEMARALVRVAAFVPWIAACLGIYRLWNMNENPERTLRRYNFNKSKIVLESAPLEKKTEPVITLARRLGAAFLFLPAVLGGYWAVCATPNGALGTAGIPGIAVAAAALGAFSFATFKMMLAAEPEVKIEDELLETRLR